MEGSILPLLIAKRIDLPSLISVRYLLSLPPSYLEDPNKRWPLLLFLHGSGESGNDLELVKAHGIPRLVQVYDDWKSGKVSKDDILNEDAKVQNTISEKDSSLKPKKPISLECAKIVAENFITVSPQIDPVFGYGWKSNSLAQLLDSIENEYRVDKQRIYITGLSMGGFGTFYLASSYPERFAAILPICGGVDVKLVPLFKDVPMWIVHGKKDQIVHVKNSEKVVNALEKLGIKVKTTFYPDADHDSWTDTYNNAEIYKWLLAQTLSVSLNKSQ